MIGSAVYVGKWLQEATRFVSQHENELDELPVWIFSSGPIGEPPKPAAEQSVNVEDIVQRIAPREHRVLSGRVDTSKLGFGERAIMRAVRPREGDYRDWDEIGVWAKEIAQAFH